MARHPLAARLDAAAHGHFPPTAGTLAVVPAPAPYRGAVVAFTAHTVVAADVASDQVRGHLPSGDLGAPVSALWLAWLGQQLGVQPGLVDVVLVHFSGCGWWTSPWSGMEAWRSGSWITAIWRLLMLNGDCDRGTSTN
jgi:hypothetical protein